MTQARTLWEEGHRAGPAGRRRSGSPLTLTASSLDLLLDGRLTASSTSSSSPSAPGAGAAGAARDFFTVGVLPPLLMLGVFALLGVSPPGAIAHPSDGVIQAVVTGLPAPHGASWSATRSAWPCSGDPRRLHRRGPPAAAHGDSNRPGRPRPRARPPGTPSDQSTTVVGTGGRLPGSMTMSTTWSSSSLISQPRSGARPRPGRISVLVSIGSPAPRAARRRPRGRGSAPRRSASWGASAAAAPRRSPAG